MKGVLYMCVCPKKTNERKRLAWQSIYIAHTSGSMVRLDRGSRWLPPSVFPQPGTIGRLVRDREFLPGPAQYEGANPPLGSDIKGGVINKGPMRPPTEQMGPGPGQYVTTEAIDVRLPGKVDGGW